MYIIKITYGERKWIFLAMALVKMASMP